jgi:cytochrome c-type biogenesis protein
MDVTLGAALFAGLVSFLSPCVLPVVPAYLGQLGIVATRAPVPMPSVSLAAAVATPGGSASPALSTVSSTRGGWRAMPNAIAFVLGFTAVFTLVGLVLYQATGPLREQLPLLRQLGGVILVILGLNLMGVLHLRTLWRSWKPFERFGASPTGGRSGVVGGFALGAAFGVGWTPCIGPILGAILTMAVVGASPQVVALLIAYCIGLGVPFLLMALAVDRAPVVTRPLIRYGRQIEIVGGALVVFMGLALIFDWLGWFSRSLSFLWPQV